MVIFIEALVISPELRRKISQIAREMGFDYDVIKGDDPFYQLTHANVQAEQGIPA